MGNFFPSLNSGDIGAKHKQTKNAKNGIMYHQSVFVRLFELESLIRRMRYSSALREIHKSVHEMSTFHKMYFSFVDICRHNSQSLHFIKSPPKSQQTSISLNAFILSSLGHNICPHSTTCPQSSSAHNNVHNFC